MTYHTFKNCTKGDILCKNLSKAKYLTTEKVYEKTLIFFDSEEKLKILVNH